jgi:hypothetical protein
MLRKRRAHGEIRKLIGTTLLMNLLRMLRLLCCNQLLIGCCLLMVWEMVRRDRNIATIIMGAIRSQASMPRRYFINYILLAKGELEKCSNKERD